jgi:hypothetical protein
MRQLNSIIGANGFKVLVDTDTHTINFTSFECLEDTVINSIKYNKKDSAGAVTNVEGIGADVDSVDVIIQTGDVLPAGMYFGLYDFTEIDLTSGRVKINLK